MKELGGLEYETSGDGEAVLFIHGAILSDAFAPMMSLSLLQGFRCIRYRRRGYGGSEPVDGEPTIEGFADDALALLESLDASPVHVVAHSGGGPIAVQMAVSAPEVVRSLVLLEPALQDAEMAVAFDELLTPLVQMYDAGDRAKAVHLFMRTATSSAWRAETEKHVPGAAARAEVDAAATFHIDLPALRRWDFSTVRDRLSQPTLLLVGELSKDRVRPASNMLREAVPSSEYAVIEGSDHSLQTTRPEAVAPVIVEFLRRQSAQRD